MPTNGRKGSFELTVPLDAAEIKGLDRPVQVAVFGREGVADVRTVRFAADKKASASFSFDDNPGRVRVVVGPENATIDELRRLQTIGVDIPAHKWNLGEVLLNPIAISPYYWDWWIWWCRDFTVTGRVLCPDGSPVPGATVCAYDIDAWWWWISEENVGCATTDATGSFTLTFRRRCGWLPIWWWEQRNWRIEPSLAERIVPVLQGDPRIRTLPVPSPRPSLALFNDLLDERRPVPSATDSFQPTALAELRGRLLERLPAITELERFCLWPWCDWWPWWDCDADIILRVTQNCRGEDVVIHDETFFDTRWEIPTTLNVTLVANDQACCIPQCNDPNQCPSGDCIVIEGVCDLELADNIGGNFGAPASPAGYSNPGVASYLGDRPHAGTVPIRGMFGDLAGVDFYEILWATSLGGPWNAMPPAAAGGFGRVYWGPQLGGGPVDFHTVSVATQPISGRNVFESVAHFEAATGFVTPPQYWVDDTMLMNWLTENTGFADGTYYLQVLGYTEAGGDLVDPRRLPQCDTELDNYLVLTIDNRLVGAAAGHPIDHPCGGVHLCTTEPDDNIFGIRINGVSVNPCDIVKIGPNEPLEIDLMAHDPDGHLSLYTLDAVWGLNQINWLISLGGPMGGAVLLPGPAHGGIPPAAQVGPDYGVALSQGAASPTWSGGTVTFSIPDVTKVFPEQCAYTLQLWTYKRTIYGCNYGIDGHANLSEFSLTITY